MWLKLNKLLVLSRAFTHLIFGDKDFLQRKHPYLNQKKGIKN